jgi:hypothetical protein
MPLSVREYNRQRLLVYESPFQSDISWPFRALLSMNHSDIARSIQFVASRIVNSGSSEQLTSKNIQEAVQQYFQGATGETIFKKYYPIIGGAIRGSAMYWARSGRHLKTMVSNLGWPTFFLTFGNADVHWFDVFHAIDPTV